MPGFAQLMRRVAPIIQSATASSDESNLDLLRRLAASKVKQPPPAPQLERLQQPPAALPSAPTTQPPLPTVPAALEIRGDEIAPYRGPKPQGTFMGDAPDLTTEPRNAAMLERIAALGRPANGPLQTATEPVPEAGLMTRPTQSLEELPSGLNLSGLNYDVHGRPLKPQYVDPTSDAALMARDEYRRALESYEPENHNSRLKSALITGGRGALAGLAHGPGGALGGFVTGLGMGAASPAIDERYARDRDLAQVNREIAGDLDLRRRESQLANEEVERQYKRAQAQRALNPQYKPDVITLSNGDVVSVDGGTATPVLDARGKTVKGKVNASYEWRNDPFSGKAELWERRAGEVDKKVPGATDVSKDLIQSAQGWVRPGTALMADATAENRDYGRNRNVQLDARHERERGEDISLRVSDKEQARREKAAAIAGDVAKINAQAGAYQDLAARTPADAKDATGQLLKPYYESLASSEKQKGVAKALELREGYGDLFEAGPGEGGWAFVKPKATQPQLSSRPAKSGGIQAGEDANVRAYANQYFGGDYKAASEAIRKQQQR